LIPKIKICGITSKTDLTTAIEAGADAVGFLVGQKYPSADFISPQLARSLLQTRYPFLTTVLVTHEEDPAAIVALAEAVPTRAIQVHSDVGVGELVALRQLVGDRVIIGKITVEDRSCLSRLSLVSSVVDAIVLDSMNRQTGQVGGTGLTHDWVLSAELRKASTCPVVLAGGLRPTNVRTAIALVKPFAVDVNSGVENVDGRKSSSLIRQFVLAARAASADTFGD